MKETDGRKQCGPYKMILFYKLLKNFISIKRISYAYKNFICMPFNVISIKKTHMSFKKKDGLLISLFTSLISC